MSRSGAARPQHAGADDGGTQETGSGLMSPLSQNKVWSYVGRFVTSWAIIENTVNQLFQELIFGQPADQPVIQRIQQISATVGLFVTYSFDLRKKLELIDVILKGRGVDESKTFKRVHELHDLRNVICHFPFEEELDQTGLSCDFIDKYGRGGFKILGTSEKDNLITYAEFDSIDAIASELGEKLFELLQSATPITDVSDELRDAMKEVIGSSVH
jgi:hypothetical protein